MTALVRLPFRASDAYRARLDGCERGARERLARIEGSTPASDTARMMANASVAYASMMRDYSTRVGELFSRLDDRRRNSQQSAAALDAIASPVVTSNRWTVESSPLRWRPSRCWTPWSWHQL